MAAGPAAKTSGFAHNKQWNWRNFWICLAVGFIGEFAAAYSSCIIGVTLAQPAFLKYMGLVDENQKLTDNATPLIGATGGTFQAGAFFGVLITCWIMDKYGRKAATIFCATVSIIGGVCLCAAQSIGMFIAFRFVTGMGGISYTPVVVVYCVELAPPKLRGFFVGMNAMGITFGYAAASYMGLAFYYVEEAAAQWRGPLGLALVFSIAVLAVLPFVPESPRWLLMVGRVDEARDIIQTLHHIDGDPEQVYARAEFLQMKEQTELDRSLSPTWYQMFTRPSYRRRIVTACGLVFLGQSTAVLVINYYGPTIYKALGYDTLDQLIFQAGWLTLAIPSNFIGVGCQQALPFLYMSALLNLSFSQTCLMDRVGRKPLMLGSMIGCCAALVVETALIARFASPIGSTPNTAALRAGVAML